ncbi:recombinase family protein [Cryobacterium sp. 10I5]|uniref:recombinase family protein n=1 Tax=Cryobacterium sp. 10I5 TaxID=3048581 RepID=UPI002B223C20|nr:recombinase family protein [Cryobacterium sp. 10I5]MEB0265897.1 recombinase family protein [Cryobacterium sp. 10I5]
MNTIIYVRQSLDRDGAGAAVERQLTECRALAVQTGLEIAHEYVDNDVSASKGTRPGFQELLSAIKAGTVSTIIVWHTDRLYRRVRDLVELVELAEKHALRILTVKAGDLDLNNAAGRMMAQILGAAARYEVEQKGARQVAANVQRANAGVWQFSNRPYGYERVEGKVQIVEPEAVVLRDAYARYLAGESYYSIVDDLNTRGTLTTTGKPWSITTLRARLRNPAYAGIREYKGDAVAQGDWEPIITRKTWDEYTRLRTHRKTPHDWSNKTKYLLSGLALCGVCGGRMLARPDYPRNGVDRPPRIAYACTAKWCTQRDQERLDGLVEDVIVARFSQADVLDLMRVDQDVAPQEAEALELRRRWDDLAELVADGTMRPAAVREQSAIIQGKLAQLQAAIDKARGGSTMTDLALASDTAAKWAGFGLPQKRQVITSLLTVTVSKQKNTRVFDPNDVTIKWLS